MAEIRISLSNELKECINERALSINLSNQEYIRKLIELDLNILNYEKVNNYIETLYDEISKLKCELSDI